MSRNALAIAPGQHARCHPGATATPTLDRHEIALCRYSQAAVNTTERARAALVPVGDLRRILAEADAALAAYNPPPLATQEQAATLGQLLVGSFPHAKPAEPKIYASALVAILREYDAGTGSRAVNRLIRSSLYVPTAAELLAACEAERVDPTLAKLRSIRRLALLQLAQHAERDHDAAVERDRAIVGPKLAALRLDLAK